MAEKPKVEKRLYTRLMDVYRHSDLYIPGFNLLTRSTLRLKAESAVAKTSKSITGESISRTNEWYQKHRFFFGFGVYRSGTTFLADFLNRNVNDAIVMHEANVNDYWYYAKAMHSHDEAKSYLADYRRFEIKERLDNQSFSVYGEINPFLRRHCSAVSEVFPDAKLFHIVRDPRKVIRSLMSRELFGKKDPMDAVVYPPSDDPYAKNWQTISRFEKLCWLWAADNKFIREHVNHLVRFEDIRSDYDHFKMGICDFLDLDVSADTWKKEIGTVFNSTPNYRFPEYSNWTQTQKDQLEAICGPEMARYGY